MPAGTATLGEGARAAGRALIHQMASRKRGMEPPFAVPAIARRPGRPLRQEVTRNLPIEVTGNVKIVRFGEFGFSVREARADYPSNLFAVDRAEILVPPVGTPVAT